LSRPFARLDTTDRLYRSIDRHPELEIKGVRTHFQVMCEHFKPSSACCVVHLGLKGVEQKALDEIEGYYWDDYVPDAVLRSVYHEITTTPLDPALAPEGGRILIAQTVTPRSVEPGVDWETHKAEVEDYIMGRLRKLLPGIDDHIVVRLTATARTSHQFTRNTHGAMLGWEMSPEQLGAARIPNMGPVKNLYFVGHWTRPGGGVTPVMIGAQRVAREILTGRGSIQVEADEFFASLSRTPLERRSGG
jgi:phytoene dehydrogenase-like protein